MSQNILPYLIAGLGGVFVLLVLIYVAISKKMQTKDTKYVRQLVEGTKRSNFLNMEVFLSKILYYM